MEFMNIPHDFKDRRGNDFIRSVFFKKNLGVEGTIGFNYGIVASNLPPPAQVAHFLLESTIISRVRLFDADSNILKAFAHTGIAVSVTVPNDEIPRLT